MRRIDRTGQFKRDYKREIGGSIRQTLDADLMAVPGSSLPQINLAERYHDHSLTG